MDISTIPINPGHLVVLMILLNGIGSALKRWPRFPDHGIPMALSMSGAIANGILNRFEGEPMLIGAAIGMMAVGGHQILRQWAGQSVSDTKKARQSSTPGPAGSRHVTAAQTPPDQSPPQP